MKVAFWYYDRDSVGIFDGERIIHEITGQQLWQASTKDEPAIDAINRLCEVPLGTIVWLQDLRLDRSVAITRLER